MLHLNKIAISLCFIIVVRHRLFHRKNIIMLRCATHQRTIITYPMVFTKSFTRYQHHSATTSLLASILVNSSQYSLHFLNSLFFLTSSLLKKELINSICVLMKLLSCAVAFQLLLSERKIQSGFSNKISVIGGSTPSLRSASLSLYLKTIINVSVHCAAVTSVALIAFYFICYSMILDIALDSFYISSTYKFISRTVVKMLLTILRNSYHAYNDSLCCDNVCKSIQISSGT